jgi:hypothetical protein
MRANKVAAVDRSFHARLNPVTLDHEVKIVLSYRPNNGRPPRLIAKLKGLNLDPMT